MVTPAPSAKTPPTVPAAVPRQGVPDESPGSAAPPPARTPDLPVNAPARKNGKTKRKAAGGPRTRNWLAGECVGLLTAAATHWASLRSRRTALGKTQATAALLQAFVEATPAKDRASARARDINQALRKIKSLRTKYMATRKVLVQTGLSTAQREDALLAFGGSVLYELARGVFRKSSVSNEMTVREPVVLGTPPAPTTGAAGGATGAAAAVNAGGVAAGTTGPAAAGNAGGAATGTTGAAAVGPDVAESDGTEASAESGSDASDDVEAATTSAVNVLVAAEGKSPDKKPKKETTAGVLRDYIKSKIDRENAAAESTNCSGPSRDRADGNGVSDDAIRRAVLDMITAYTEKARRD